MTDSRTWVRSPSEPAQDSLIVLCVTRVVTLSVGSPAAVAVLSYHEQLQGAMQTNCSAQHMLHTAADHLTTTSASVRTCLLNALYLHTVLRRAH